MKRCPICAELIDDHLSVCPFCGERLSGTMSTEAPQEAPTSTRATDTDREPTLPSPYTDERQSAPEAERKSEQEAPRRTSGHSAPSPYTPPVTPSPEQKGNPLKWLLLLLCSLLAIGIALLIYLLWGKGDGDPKEENEPSSIAVQPVATPSYSEASVKQLLDSVAKAIPNNARAVATYPDSARQSFYYLADGEMKVYRASTGTTETIAFPAEAGDVVALSAEKDSEDDSFIIIESGDNDGNSKGFYIIDTFAGDLSPMAEGEELMDEGGEATDEEYPQEMEEKQKPVAKNPPPTPRKRQTYDDDDEYRHERQDEGGTDFHLEPVGEGIPQGQQQGTGMRLQKIDHIPNTRR